MMELGGVALATLIFAILAVYLYRSSRVKGVEGLQVVYEDAAPEVDVVAVHGLGGDSRETWAADLESGTVNWLDESLPRDLHRRVQVLTCGYSTRLFSDAAIGVRNKATALTTHDDRALQYLPQALDIHSRRLIVQLIALRGVAGWDRPIIWIGHGVGGLMVKKVLVEASAAVGAYKAHKAIQLSTCGTLFFATPMRGTPREPWSKILNRSVSISLGFPQGSRCAPNGRTVDALELQLQRYKSIEKRIRNYSFCEYGRAKKRRAQKRRIDNTFVITPWESSVPENASDSWQRIQLRASHRNLVKFEDRSDRNYQKVLLSINTCLENAENIAERTSIYFQRLEKEIPQRMYAMDNSGLSEDLVPSGEGDPPLGSAEDTVIEDSSNVEPTETLRREHSRNPSQVDALRRQLSQSERSHGSLHPSTITCVQELARQYLADGEYLKAELLYKRAFVSITDSDTRGPWHPNMIRVLKPLASVQIGQGKFAAATENLKHLQTFEVAKYGEESSQTLRTRACLAILYDKQKRWQDAESTYKAVIQIREKRDGGSNKEETLAIMENLGLSYRLRGRKALRKAAEQYEDVLCCRKENVNVLRGEIKRSSNTDQDHLNEKLNHSEERMSATVSKLVEVCEAMGNTKRRLELLEENHNLVLSMVMDTQR